VTFLDSTSFSGDITSFVKTMAYASKFA
jgi:hypothetical protein